MSCRRINEALLPAFAAFILLSYTKLSLTSSYISSTQALIDENGNKTDSLRVYFAGYLTIHDPHYRYRYLFPSIVITIFVCAIPLLLLHYPLRGLEWIISKVPFLRKLYPIDKVHVFLDTFQGCYRNRMRFFAGVYFLFRLILNVIYVATGSWLQQYIAQQIVCIVMITLIAICRPYNRDYWIFNYVDILMFANLATVNAFTLYLYSQNGNADQVHSLSPFIFQYVLVFLPLVFMICYIIWYLSTRFPILKTLVKKSLCCSKDPRRPYEQYRNIQGQTGGALTRSELDVDELHLQDEDEPLFDRARSTNHFKQGNAGNAQPGKKVDGTQQSMTRVTDSRNTASTRSTVSKGYGSISSGNLSTNSSHGDQ